MTSNLAKSKCVVAYRTGQVLLLCVWIGFALVASTVAVAQGQTTAPPTTSVSSPPRGEATLHMIVGVPFVKWGDAARLNYSGKATQNPSYAAAWAMILEYWGRGRKELELRRDPTEGWRDETNLKPSGLEGIKSLLDRKIPVLVCPAVTPFAHRQDLALAVWIMMKKAGIHLSEEGKVPLEQFKLMIRTAYAFEQEGPASGAFGAWLPLESYQTMAEQGAPARNDSVVHACRVVIGYDDSRRVLVLHDPTFGPAWEVSYDDFWKMWNFDRWYVAKYPADYSQILAKKSRVPAYVRSPDNEAAVRYVYGYAWQSIGQPAEAEREYRQGLSLAGVGPAYHHLLNMDLAVTLTALGRPTEALPYARRATELMPQASRAWHVLAKILPSSGGNASTTEREAADAEERARTLCSEQYESAVAATLGQDFSLLSCKGNVYLVWGVANGMSTTGKLSTFQIK